ncbi:MAG TPA: rod shape-determining protein [Syntrophomonadaceae bacterium]|nr:rod shape-determining protein [Syntrophomonadaceae bacterium]
MFFEEDIGIDLGTASVLVFKKGKGIILHEPSVVAYDKTTNKVIAVGEEARQMLGRTPGHIVAVRPLKDGVIADYDMTEKMLTHFMRKAMGKKLFFKPRVIVCIPTGSTDVEERAVKQATLSSGARQSFIIEEPLSAALGAGINISEATGNMVVDIGGGTTDIAVLSLGGIVCNTSLRLGGDKFDEAFIRYIRREYNLMIGDRTAEELKLRVGTAHVNDKNRLNSMDVKGRDLVTGLPKIVNITAEQTWLALKDTVQVIIDGVKSVLESTPPELAADIINNGIVMTGGGSLLDGLDILLSHETNLPVHIADDAISCVAKGTGRALREISVISQARNKRAKWLM